MFLFAQYNKSSHLFVMKPAPPWRHCYRHYSNLMWTWFIMNHYNMWFCKQNTHLRPHAKVISYLCSTCFVKKCFQPACARTECLLTSSDPTQHWVIPQLKSESFHIQQWGSKCHQTHLSTKSADSSLSANHSWGIWPTGYMIGWSIPLSFEFQFLVTVQKISNQNLLLVTD